MAGGTLPKSHSRILFARSRVGQKLRLVQRWVSGGKETSPFKVEVVEVQHRRFPWLLIGAAGSAGIYALHLQRQRDLQKAEEAAATAAELKATEAAKAAAEAAATAAAAAADAAKEEARKAAEAEAAAAAAAAREAEAQKAAEAEAQKLAAKQALLESMCLRCSQLLSEVRIIEDGAEYYSASDADNEDLHSLLAALQACVKEDAFKDLQESKDEKSQMASQLLSSLTFLRLFVERLQKADSAERHFDVAISSIRAARRRWLAGQGADVLVMEDGVAQAEAALGDLDSTGLKSDVSEEVMESARLTLKEMKDEEQRRHAQEVSSKALEAAMSTPFDRKVCEQTAKDAREAGCPQSAALEIAERVVQIHHDKNIPKLYESIDTLSQVSTNKSSPKIPSDLQPEDYVNAAKASMASMTEAQLIEEMSHLAEALAIHHQIEVRELSSAWTAILPTWEGHSQEKVAGIKEEFAKSKELGKESSKVELKTTAARHLSEAIQDAIEEVQERSERDIYDLYSSTNLQLQEDLTAEIRSFDSYFRSLPEIFTSRIQELWQQGGPQHRVAKASYSAASTLASDPSVCSPEELQRAFQQKLPELVALAFEPEDAGILGSFLGRLFGRLYKIKGEQVELSMQEDLESKLGAIPIHEGQVVQKNLRTLAEALRLVELGEMRAALMTLDGLAGGCRERAEEWISLARQSLLFQQASDAARARMLCLAMTLAE